MVTVTDRTVVTDRDIRVLQFAVEMFGVPMTVAADLGRTANSASPPG